MDPVRSLAVALVPPLCAACGGPCHRPDILCPRCDRALAAAPAPGGRVPAGLDAIFSAAAHDDTARELVAALKFRRLLAVAEPMAERIERLAPAGAFEGSLVPVPAAPLRHLRRGFDPAAELAAALGRRLGREPCACMSRRGGGRQVGRGRIRRLGDPPQVRASAPVPCEAVLVDDVLTTGATLSACARVLRGAGARSVTAVTFTRRL